MTQKDFIKIAWTISGLDIPKAACVEVVKDFCKILKEDNPRFDRTRFIIACGLQVHEVDGNPPTPAKILFYVEFRSGNCSMVEASTHEVAREEARGLMRIPGDTVRLARTATQQDIDDFYGKIYHSGR